MKALFVSNLFPDAEEPLRGQDNANLIRRMPDDFDWRVISPRPGIGIGGRGVVRRPLERDEVLEPRYPGCAYIPKMGAPWNALLMRRVLRAEIEKTRTTFPFRDYSLFLALSRRRGHSSARGAARGAARSHRPGH